MKIGEKIFSSSKIPFFILLFICFASAILGDSVAEALILSHYSAAVIPRMYMVNALFLFLSSLFLISLIDRVDRGMFFMIFMLTHSLFLFLVWCAVSFHFTFLYIPLFSYSYISKIFLFLLFWTLANDITDSRSAGKDFPFIAAGGTLGAILISFSIPWLLTVMSAKSLLLVWIVLCLLIFLFFIPIRRSFGNYFKPISDIEKHSRQSVKSVIGDITLLKREPLLLDMSILYLLIFFGLLNQHYSFYEVIKVRYVEAERLAGFLGYFNGTSMFLTFFIQITLAGIIIKKMGSTRSMFMLPAAFCLVFGTLGVMGLKTEHYQVAAVASSGMFWGIVSGVGLRIAFFDSFFSPNFQIFFSSLPRDIRGRGKLVIEGVVKPTAIVCASLWILFVSGKIPFCINMMILLVLSIGMILQTFRIKGKYTERLSQYLVGFQSRASLSVFDYSEIADSKDILSFLSEKLVNEEYEIKCYIIEILTDSNSEESIKILTDYIYLADKKTRATIISSLTRLKLESLKSVFSSMLQDSDPHVIANSIFALAAYNDIEINEGLRVFLYNTNSSIKANTIISLWSSSKPVIRRKLLQILKEMLESESTETKGSALFALGEINSPEHTGPLLKEFCNTHEDVLQKDRRIRHHFLPVAAKHPDEELIQMLFTLSGQVGKKERGDIVSTIAEACGSGYPLNSLLKHLEGKDAVRRGIVLKVLSVLKNYYPAKETEQVLIPMAQDEAVFTYDAQLSYRLLMKEANNDALKLLAWVIFEESISLHIENLFFIAAILDRTGQVNKAIRRIDHENKHVRARALEVLDNIGNLKINRNIIKLIEKNEKLKSVKTVPGSIASENDSIRSIINTCVESPIRWINECAKYAREKVEV